MQIRPRTVSLGGLKKVQKFDGYIQKMGVDASSQALAALATPILDEVDNLEHIYGV